MNEMLSSIQNRAIFYANSLEVSYRIALISQCSIVFFSVGSVCLAAFSLSAPILGVSIVLFILSVILAAMILGSISTIRGLPQKMESTLHAIIQKTSVAPGINLLRKADTSSSMALKKLEEEAKDSTQNLLKAQQKLQTLKDIQFMSHAQVQSLLQNPNDEFFSVSVSTPVNSTTEIIPLSSLPHLFSESLKTSMDDVSSSSSSISSSSSRSFSIPFKLSKTPTIWSNVQSEISKKTTLAFLVSSLIVITATALTIISLVASQWIIFGSACATTWITFGIMLLFGLPIRNKDSGTTLNNELVEEISNFAKYCLYVGESHLIDLSSKQIKTLQDRQILSQTLPLKIDENLRSIQAIEQDIQFIENQIKKPSLLSRAATADKLKLWTLYKERLDNFDGS